MYIFHMFLLCHHSNDNHQHRYGVSWHKSGQKTNKQNVFDDFIAAGEYLIENKYVVTFSMFSPDTFIICITHLNIRRKSRSNTGTQQRISLQSWVVATVVFSSPRARYKDRIFFNVQSLKYP